MRISSPCADVCFTLILANTSSNGGHLYNQSRQYLRSIESIDSIEWVTAENMFQLLELNDLLLKAGIEPKNVLVMRHRPTEQGLRKVLPWFAVDRPDVFNAYQQAQANKNVEAALKRAGYLASFIGIEPGMAYFVGLYCQRGFREITREQYFEIPENIELGRHGLSAATPRASALWFNLVRTETYLELQGRLVITWTGLERSWYRWSHRNNLPISAILAENNFAQQMPHWRQLVLSWAEISSLPIRWQATLREWRGIYLITDQSDGKSYVGSAYGEDNLLGRWTNYAASGHGGNRLLRDRDPNQFVFCILERVSPDFEAAEVIALENSWKERLQTRTPRGLNSN